MKLPIIEHDITLNAATIAVAVDETRAIRFLRAVEAAVLPGVVLAGPLGIQAVNREIEVAAIGDVDAHVLDTAALATAYDDLQVAKRAAQAAAPAPPSEPEPLVVKPPPVKSPVP